MSKTKTNYISASQIDRFLECPLAYKYIYVDGCERLPWNIYMSYGTAIHEALAINYRQKITSRVDLPVQTVIDLFVDIFQKEVAKLGWMWSIYWDANTLSLQGEQMIYQYQNEYAKFIMPALVEEKFEIELDSYPVTILWYIDLVTEDWIIIDHKTAGSSTGGKWTQNYVDMSNQLTIYALAYRKLFQRFEKSLRIDVLQRNKTGPVFKSIETVRSDLQIVSLVQLMARMNEIVEKDIWFPNLNSCATCDFKNNCNRLSYFKK